MISSFDRLITRLVALNAANPDSLLMRMIALNAADPNALRPPKSVLDYLRSKGLKLSWNWADVWKEEHRVAFTVAGVMEKDILADIKLEIDRALDNGQPFQQFKKSITPILADKGWLARRTVKDPITGEEKDVELGDPRRLRTIFKTNTDMARAAGQWERIVDDSDIMPYLRYVHGPSHVPRPDHLALNNLILPIDDPFWKTHYPPNGFGCTCSVIQISARQAKKLGGVSASPKLKMVEWRNKRTGVVQLVPEGCDPGFDFNVGMDRMRGINEAR